MRYALVEFYSPVLTTAEDGTAKTWGEAQADDVRIFNTLAELQEEIEIYLVSNGENDLLGCSMTYAGGFQEVFVGFQINLVADDDTDVLTEDAYE